MSASTCCVPFPKVKSYTKQFITNKNVNKKRNKAIKNPECTCFKCLKETKENLHTIEIPQTGYGSRFDGLNTKIQLCDKCYKLTNPNWWKFKQIPIKELGDAGHNFTEYKYENEIFEYVNQMPLAGQELFFNRFASGAGADYMDAQEWIDGELNYECL